jgi:integrase
MLLNSTQGIPSSRVEEESSLLRLRIEEAGWDPAFVQRRLGHAQIQTTVNTYAHLSSRDLGNMFARYQKERTR